MIVICCGGMEIILCSTARYLPQGIFRDGLVFRIGSCLETVHRFYAFIGYSGLQRV